MDKVTREVGRCLTETKRKDFDTKVKEYAEFVHASQFVSQPKHVSEIKGALSTNPKISYGEFLYGVEQDGSLTWLGQIIDSSD